MATVSEIDQQIAALQAEKQKLIEKEKSDALAKVQAAIKELNALGFNYSLTQAGDAPEPTTRTRRPGVRADVLSTIKANPNGIAPSDIITALGYGDDKKGQNAVRNALSALKKAGEVTADNSLYTASAA